VAGATAALVLVAAVVGVLGWARAAPTGRSPAISTAVTGSPVSAPTGSAPPGVTSAPAVGAPTPSGVIPPAPAPTVRTSVSVAAPPPAPDPGPTTPSPSAAPPTVDQALTELRSTIDNAVPAGLDDDMARDLRNSVDNLAATLMMNPTQDVSGLVRSLQQKVKVRSMDMDSIGHLRMSTPTRTALLDGVAALNAALGYPALT
jgi:hypothetical protein